MGIKEKKFLVATCDICGTELDSVGFGSFTVYETEGELRDAIGDCDWTWANGKVRCEGCYEEVDKLKRLREISHE